MSELGEPHDPDRPTTLVCPECRSSGGFLHETAQVSESVPLDENGYPTDPYGEVVPGLFQADTTFSPSQLFHQGFDAVFDVCGIDRGDGVLDEIYVVHPLDDVPWIPDHAAIDELGERVAGMVRSGRKVVVNCMSGLNRSGLVVGRALIALGYTPTEAVELIRKVRGPRALFNRAFTKFLLIDCTPRGLAARQADD